MSISLDGMCINVIFDLETNLIRFYLQDSFGKYTLCEFTPPDKLPIKKGDMIFCSGDYESKILAGEFVNIFICSNLTARYEFDLLNFLIQYMPYMKVDDKHDMETVTQYYRDVTDRVSEYCNTIMGGFTSDKICDLFNGLYRCISIDDQQPLIEFAQFCFRNASIKKIKNFLVIWNNDVLIRPLQLLGLSETEIKSIHIPLNEAYEIIKKNPFRFPQYSLEKANKIVENHLRLQPAPYGFEINHEKLDYNSIFVRICGSITRMVYDNIDKRKWSSTPIAKIKEQFPMYDDYRDILFKYYYLIEEFDHVYFTKIHGIERSIGNKISFLINKAKSIIPEPVFPALIPSEKQQIAIKGALENNISLIHGGPGTGKTAIMSELVRTISMMGKKSLCLAFTGAATTRIRETTINNGVFDLTTIMTINMAITLVTRIIDMNIEYVIIDEISMVNSGLISMFISAFKLVNYKLILIGDDNQLEPIEWGNFMCQILKTPVTKYHLTENFRSEKTIVSICEDVINKQRIQMQQSVNWNIIGNDYRFTIGNLNVLEQWISWYANSFEINSELSQEENIKLFEKYRDRFTIISPYKKVVEEINPIFQKYFMSYIKEYTELGGTKFYLGDRVMKLINDYGINVMNGEQGKVIKIAPSYIVCIFRNRKETITPYVEKSKFTAMKAFVKKNNITFNPYNIAKDGTSTEKTKEEIKTDVDNLRKQYLAFINSSDPNNDIIGLYFSLLEEYPLALYNIGEEAEFLNIKNLCLAYAITTHKSQGSQYDIDIFFLNGKMNCFVTVNNVYTALSRAKGLLHIITESVELLNNACLNKQRYVYDKLYERINSKLSPELLSTMEPILELENIDESGQNFDEFELPDDYDIGY